MVQLDTATKILETRTVPDRVAIDGVAVDGLKTALKFLKRNSPAISTLLKTDSKLAIKIIYLLDRELQFFFCVLGDAADDMSLMDENDEYYLHNSVKPGYPRLKRDKPHL